MCLGVSLLHTSRISDVLEFKGFACHLEGIVVIITVHWWALPGLVRWVPSHSDKTLKTACFSGEQAARSKTISIPFSCGCHPPRTDWNKALSWVASSLLRFLLQKIQVVSLTFSLPSWGSFHLLGPWCQLGTLVTLGARCGWSRSLGSRSCTASPASINLLFLGTYCWKGTEHVILLQLQCSAFAEHQSVRARAAPAPLGLPSQAVWGGVGPVCSQTFCVVAYALKLLHSVIHDNNILIWFSWNFNTKSVRFSMSG